MQIEGLFCFLTYCCYFWGLLPAAGATLQGSQLCSALRRKAPRSGLTATLSHR
ncbi:hypothetical protein SGRA_1382 [Saprospira grandis str. Lewin]|uniref:Uncharacterized protein n=1 Tax=Saprospira grandis (strain Lewin) TaxID=984262 RepID=H6L6H5_SAPGL|nr:hypothetical protein SGRA_1382 [Saprospira grandis str. Lewin]